MRCHKILSIALLVSAGCAAQGLLKLKPGFNLFSKQQDIELGQAAATEMVQQLQIVPDPDLKVYLERIGRKLASQPQNAFALPGGPTFVHSGLILAYALGLQILAGLLGEAVPGESVWGQLSELGIAAGANSK